MEFDRDVPPVVAAPKACEGSEAYVGGAIDDLPQPLRSHASDFAHVEVPNAAGADSRVELAARFETTNRGHVHAEAPRDVATRYWLLENVAASPGSAAGTFPASARLFGGSERGGAINTVGWRHSLFDRRHRR